MATSGGDGSCDVKPLELNGPLVLVGCGKLGGALLTGWLAGGLDPSSVIVQDPGPPKEIEDLLQHHRICRMADVRPLARSPAVLLMAVKPQVMDSVFKPLAQHVGPNTVVVSVAAGRTLASFERFLPGGTAVVRTIPNTPAAVGRGITVCVGNAHTTLQVRALVDQIMGAVGDVGWVEEEHLIDAATAVSGSGPAYVFLLAECLAAAGRDIGLEPALASRLADATVAGAGELMRQTGLPPAVLRQNVTSPNGTTAAALSVLMGDDRLKKLMAEAVAAANRRSAELSG
jgi:pyrroline-5-carboxylate reductase